MRLARSDLDAGGFATARWHRARPASRPPRRPSSPAFRAMRRAPAGAAGGALAGPNRPGIAGIAARAHRDLVGHLPGVVEGRGEHAVAALAQAVMAAAAIERADRRLEAEAAAIARRPDGRADHLGAERGAHHAGGDRRRRAAARSAGRAAQVIRVARAARMGGGEFGRHRLAEDDRAGFAQRGHGRGVALRAPAGEERRAVLGRHVDGLDDVLDADRHAVDLRQRIGRRASARPSRVGGFARAVDVEMDEGADLAAPASRDRRGSARENRAARRAPSANAARAAR